MYTSSDIIVVTGASSGIGYATSKLLNRLGASVIACGRSFERLNCLANEVINKDNLYIEVIDLLDNIESLPEWVKSLKERYGKLKSIVCCAGLGSVKPLNMVDYDSMKLLMDIHYFVPVLLAKGFADRRVNIGLGSSIVFISSIAAYMGYKGSMEYGAAKSAISSATKSLANELYSKHIRVNSVSPGYIDTPMVNMNSREEIELLKQKHLFGHADDVANLISFIISDNGCWINGQDIVIDGGSTLPHII